MNLGWGCSTVMPDRFQLTFSVSLSTSSRGEWAAELPLEWQQALPSQSSLQRPPKQGFSGKLLAQVFFLGKRHSVR